MLNEQTKPVDLLMWVGNLYSVLDFVREAKNQGMSKRISITSIPEGVVPMRSKLFVASRKAILKVTAKGRTLSQLVQELFEAGAFTADQLEAILSPDLDSDYWTDMDQPMQPGDRVPDQMLNVVMALDSRDPKVKRELIEKYRIIYHAGVFGYGYVSGIQYVCEEGETDLPDELAHLDGYVQPVIVEYEDAEQIPPVAQCGNSSDNH